MGANRRVVAQLLERARQVGPGIAEVAELEPGPPQGIEEGAVVGIDGQSSLDELERLVEPLAALGEEIGYIVERLGVPGVELERSLQLANRIFRPAQALVGGAQPEAELA